MIIKNGNRKNFIVGKIREVLSQKNIDIDRLILYFSEYCLYDLKIKQSELKRQKNVSYIGAYRSGVVYLNIDLNKKSLYELLNTLAHEYKHQECDIKKGKRFKTLEKTKEKNFTIKKLNTLLYYLLTDDDYEKLNLFFLDYTSKNEQMARDYAIKLVDRFIVDLEEKIDEKDVKLKKMIKYLKVHNLKKETSEEFLLSKRLNPAKNSLNYAKEHILELISLPYQSLRLSKSDKFGQFYSQYGTFAPIIDAYLSLFCDEKTCEIVLENAQKYDDRECVLELLNHENSEPSLSLICKGLSFLNNGEKITFENMKEQLYSFKEDSVITIFQNYNKLHKDDKSL